MRKEAKVRESSMMSGKMVGNEVGGMVKETHHVKPSIDGEENYDLFSSNTELFERNSDNAVV